MSVERAIVHAIDALREVQALDPQPENVDCLRDFCEGNGIGEEILLQMVASSTPVDLGRVNRALAIPQILKDSAEGVAEDILDGLPPDTPVIDNTLPVEGEPPPADDGDPVDDITWHELQQKGSDLGVYRSGMARKDLEKAIARAEAKAAAKAEKDKQRG